MSKVFKGKKILEHSPSKGGGGWGLFSSQDKESDRRSGSEGHDLEPRRGLRLLLARAWGSERHISRHSVFYIPVNKRYV